MFKTSQGTTLSSKTPLSFASTAQLILINYPQQFIVIKPPYHYFYNHSILKAIFDQCNTSIEPMRTETIFMYSHQFVCFRQQQNYLILNMHVPNFLSGPRLHSPTPPVPSNQVSQSLEELKSSKKQNNQNVSQRQNTCLSAASSPSRPTMLFRNDRSRSPFLQSQQNYPRVKNPQTIKKLKSIIIGDYQEQVSVNKIRKISDNHISICENKSDEKFNSESFTFAAGKLKQRKTSCNLDLVAQNKTAKKLTSQEQWLKQKDQQAKIALKKQIQDQNNNIHLSSYNSEQITNQFQMQQSVQIPRIQNIRKFSDHDHPKYQAPSFLHTPKVHRNSFDTSELLRKKPMLGMKNFMIVRELGQGTFGRVVLAVQKETKLICAIKIMSKREIKQGNMLEQLVRELKIQLSLHHPNIVKVYGYFDDLLYFYIIMECAMDNHLSLRIEKSPTPLPEKEVAGIMAQICSAVLALHSASIIHRDLKTENVMFHDKIVKLCDFGWSVKLDSNLRKTFCGTPIYLCPEILVGEEYDESIDIWALGIILYEMLFKSNPFKVTCQQNLVNVLNDQIYFDEKTQVSEAAKNIISMCLKKKAKERPSIRELCEHPFLKNRL